MERGGKAIRAIGTPDRPLEAKIWLLALVPPLLLVLAGWIAAHAAVQRSTSTCASPRSSSRSR